MKKWWCVGAMLVVAVVYLLMRFESVFQIMPLPQHVSQQAILTVLQDEHPGVPVMAWMSTEGEAELYARFVSNRDQALQLLREQGARRLYSWQARIKSGDQHRYAYYTLSGEPYGFYQEVLDNVHYPELTETLAKAKAWQAIGGLMADPQLVSYEQVRRRESGRLDHVVAFQEAKPLFAEAYDRVIVNVAGDRLQGVSHQVHLPDTYMQRIGEIRTLNRLLTMYGFYGLFLMAMMGFLWVISRIRSQTFSWWEILVSLSGLALFTLFGHLNDFWRAFVVAPSYFSDRLIVLSELKGSLIAAIGVLSMYTLLIIAAVTINRVAFPERIALSAWFNGQAFRDPQGRRIVIIGYLGFVFMLAFQTAFYDFTIHSLGFFLPPGEAQDPNIYLTYVPFLQPFLHAWQPGFTEELLCRVIPLGILATWCRDWRWFVLVNLLQALFFGLAHASYPADPAYTRVLELMLPAIGFGWVFWSVDMMAGVWTHFIFDAFWMGLFFAFDVGQSWVALIAVLLFFSPLLLCGYYAASEQGALRNQDVLVAKLNMPSVRPEAKPSRGYWLWACLSIALVALLSVWVQKHISVANTLSYQQSIEESKAFWRKDFATDDWYASVKPASYPYETAIMLHQQYSLDDWRILMQDWLHMGCWRVTLVAPEGQPSMRDYVLTTFICRNKVHSFVADQWHYEAAGEAPTEDARSLLQAEVAKQMHVPLSDLQVESFKEEQLPERVVSDAIFSLRQFKQLQLKPFHRLDVLTQLQGQQLSKVMPALHLDQEQWRQNHVVASWRTLADWQFLTSLLLFTTLLFSMAWLRGLSLPVQIAVSLILLSLYALQATVHWPSIIAELLQSSTNVQFLWLYFFSGQAIHLLYVPLALVLFAVFIGATRGVDLQAQMPLGLLLGALTIVAQLVLPAMDYPCVDFLLLYAQNPVVSPLPWWDSVCLLLLNKLPILMATVVMVQVLRSVLSPAASFLVLMLIALLGVLPENIEMLSLMQFTLHVLLSLAEALAYVYFGVGWLFTSHALQILWSYALLPSWQFLPAAVVLLLLWGFAMRFLAAAR